MRKLTGAVFQSLDGVMQAPGGPEEDPAGGFKFGGWSFPFFDESANEPMGKLLGAEFDLLLGRRTYDIFAAYWPYADDQEAEIRDPFNRCTKYVLTHGGQPLDWENSERVGSLDDLAAVKHGDGPDLIIQGSSTLYPQLLEAGLLDRLTVMTFPVALGTGKRLFGDGTPPTTLRVVDHKVTGRGNLIVTYEPAGPVETGSFAAPAPSKTELERRQKIESGTW